MQDKDSVFTELFEKYHQSLINYCVSRGFRPTDSDDIVSEAFTRALNKEEDFLKLKPVERRAWLYKAVDYIILESYDKKMPKPFSEIDNIENYIKENDELEQLLTDEIYDEYIKQVYDSLDDDKERELLTHILNKTDYKTLEKEYCKSSEAVRTMISRFRDKLRKIVNKL